MGRYLGNLGFNNAFVTMGPVLPTIDGFIDSASFMKSAFLVLRMDGIYLIRRSNKNDVFVRGVDGYWIYMFVD